MRELNTILVTGGCGFIGSNFIRHLFGMSGFNGRVINVDKLTYAGHKESLSDIAETYPDRYMFKQIDICDAAPIDQIFRTYSVDTVVHFAAESHVDRSISGPSPFIQTNIVGTFTLLEAARKHWIQSGMELSDSKYLFHHVSTDEVYGQLSPQDPAFTETTPYDPRSPYSASKASSDHLVRAYFHTYGLPVTVSNCSNNYGPYQFPEKLIPVVILNAVSGKPIPVYGDGGNIRDWLFVEDHCRALWQILGHGVCGETYNIGGNCEVKNIDLVRTICDILDDLCPLLGSASESASARRNGKENAEHVPSHSRITHHASPITSYNELITFVTDRPGHDRRYAIDFEKINRELNWTPAMSIQEGLRRTVAWYLQNASWIEDVQAERQTGVTG